jgi:ATP-dependent HslUV protease subunit HslV
LLLLSGDGNVIEPDDGVLAIGSGGAFAQAAAKALVRHTEMPAREIAERALQIAAEICIYTNDRIAWTRSAATKGPARRPPREPGRRGCRCGIMGQHASCREEST